MPRPKRARVWFETSPTPETPADVKTAIVKLILFVNWSPLTKVRWSPLTKVSELRTEISRRRGELLAELTRKRRSLGELPETLEPPALDRELTRLAIELMFGLISRSHGEAGRVKELMRAQGDAHMAKEWGIPLYNLTAFVHAGVMHLRRCARCQWWFVTKDTRQLVCKWSPCKQQRSRERMKAARRREGAAKQRAKTATGT
jgi:hypothetical protein